MIHPHEFWWRFFPKTELTQVYFSAALRSFAVSLIGLFIPLYLFHERGFSLAETLAFFLFYSVIFALATPLAAKFSSRYGIKHTVLFSVPFYLLFVFLLYSLPHWNIHLTIISAVLGISQAFYWMGMHLVFFHVSDHEHRGEEVGKRGAAMVFSALLGPLLGGYLISSVGFNAVFALAAGFLLLAALVLFRSQEEHEEYHFSIRGVINKRHWRDSLYFASRGSKAIANGVLWPLFVFLIIDSYFSLGIVGSILSGIGGIFLLLVGRYSDHISKRKIAHWTTGLETIAWISRAFVTTITGVFGVSIFSAVVDGIRESPLGAMEYDKAQGEIAAYFVSREVFICLGRIFLLAFILLLNSLAGGLVFQGVASLASLIF